MQKLKLRKSVLPIYFLGGVWIVYALLFPLYTPLHFLIVLALSLAVFWIARALLPSSVAPEREAPPVVDTGDKQADQLISHARAAVERIHALGNTSESFKVRVQVEHLQKVATDILDHVQEYPEKAKQIRKFMNYYLPTTEKLLQSYADLSEQSVRGDNITSTMQSVENILGTIIIAFEKLLDKLFADQALDVSTDITVLQGLLAQEGLLHPQDATNASSRGDAQSKGSKG